MGILIGRAIRVLSAVFGDPRGILPQYTVISWIRLRDMVASHRELLQTMIEKVTYCIATHSA